MAIPTARALIVMDGGITGGRYKSSFGPAEFYPSRDDVSFGLFEFCRVLERTKWVGFNLAITRAHRRPLSDRGDPDADASSAGAIGPVLFGFQFNPQTFSRTQFEILFLFGVRGTRVLTVDRSQPQVDDLAPAEAAVIAQFMDAGGGVFATGDHEDLGWGLCHLIPRVRSMRRWEYDYDNPLTATGELKAAPPGTPGYPPVEPFMSFRHDTLQSGSDGTFEFDDQSDDVAQPITPQVFPQDPLQRLVLGGYPHPLLCSPAGKLLYLPDHPHEGTGVENPSLSQVVTLDGYTNPEYPLDPSTQAPIAPVVVAYGHVIGGHETYDADDRLGSTKAATVEKRFPVIVAFDGHTVKAGRVVVESTWHHFFNVNLLGDPSSIERPDLGADKKHGFYAAQYLDPASNPAPGQPLDPFDPRAVSLHPQYARIQDYYRNLIYWLIPFDATTSVFDVLLYTATQYGPLSEGTAWPFSERPGAQKEGDLSQFLWVGQLAESYFQSVRGACLGPAVLTHYALASGDPRSAAIVDHIDPWRVQPATHTRFPANPLDTLAAQSVGMQKVLRRALLGGLVCLAAHHLSNLAPEARRSGSRLHEAVPGLFHAIAAMVESWLSHVERKANELRRALSS